MQVIPATEANREEISRIFVEGFYNLLHFLCRDKTRLAKGLAHMFQLEFFFVAVEDGQVTGIAACTNGRDSSLRMELAPLRQQFGRLRGRFVYWAMHKDVNLPKYPFAMEGTAALENVAVDPAHRKKGVARALLAHIMAAAPCASFALEVADYNKHAIAFYESLGFREVTRVPQRHGAISGIRAFLYMKAHASAPVPACI